MTQDRTEIENVDVYLALIDEAAAVRLKIETDLNKQFNALRVLAAEALVVEPGAFKVASDLIYYKGGYPSENTPPKIDTFIATLGGLGWIFQLLGRLDDLNTRLKGYGFVLTPKADVEEILKKGVVLSESTKNEWDNLFGENAIPTSQEEFAKALMAMAQTLQEEICRLSDEVRVDKAETAESLGVLKPNFLTAVRFKVLSLKKDRDKMLEKIGQFETDRIENAQTAIDPLKIEE